MKDAEVRANNCEVIMKKFLPLCLVAAFFVLAAGCASREAPEKEAPAKRDKTTMSKSQERAIGHGDPHGTGGTYGPQGYRRP